MTYTLANVAAAAITFTVLAGSAHAAVPPASATATRSADAASAKPSEKRYCVRGELTGSRMPVTTCRTRKAWLAEGFDPLAKN